MNSSQQKKTQRGFTLVEVIVVAIIVAALAGVAIPMYTSYVNTSRQNAAANAAGSIASFMGACVTQSGTATRTGDENTSTESTDSLTCDATTPHTVMHFPAGFYINISNMTGSGKVTARHSAIDDTLQVSQYNY
jgi:prepilin-type N-terminal cleavage/methylation domain-containing protein